MLARDFSIAIGKIDIDCPLIVPRANESGAGCKYDGAGVVRRIAIAKPVERKRGTDHDVTNNAYIPILEL